VNTWKISNFADFVDFSPWSHTLFLIWSLVLNFFNQVSNCPSNVNIYAIKPLIWQNKLFKIAIQPSNFKFFQLKLKLNSKINFLVIKPSINSIKPWKNKIESLNIQFWIFLPKFNFLIQGVFTSSYWTVNFSKLVYFDPPWPIFGNLLGVLYVLSIDIYIYFKFFQLFLKKLFPFFDFFSLFWFFVYLYGASK